MKKFQWVFFGLLLCSTSVFSENTTVEEEYKIISTVGSILEGFTGQISNLLIFFMAMFTIGSVLGYFKMNKLSSSIQGNRELIGEKFKDYERKMKIEIKEEVMQQIVYSLDEALEKVQEHAYRKVEHTVDKLTKEIQRRRFIYQGLIYKMNQAKKYEYEEVMKGESELTEKIEKTIKIQAKYNEINNYYIPLLFSKNIEEDVVFTAKKLSSDHHIKRIILNFLLDILEEDKLNFVQKTEIKDVLKEKYGWVEEKSTK